jgi:alkaline phosphatase D
LLLGACLAGIAGAGDASPASRTVVVLLFDGFAPAFVAANPTPALDRMRAEGSFSHGFEPAFPSISLINQVTISTGCWPEHHGIVTNVFLDPERGVYNHSPDADWLTGCEHLHQTAERQGLRSAALGWVGRQSSGKDQATFASRETSATEYPPDEERGEQVIRLLALPDSERPRLILAYFRGPDWKAHTTGMESPETQAAVRQSDAIVGKVLAVIDALPYRNDVTLIVTTDHGMREVSTIVNIKKILRNHVIEARALSAGTTSFVYLADAAQIDRAAEALSTYAEFDVVRKDRQPSGWHLGTGPRVGDLIVSAKPPYFIEDVDRWPAWLRWLGDYGPEFLWASGTLKATHGYPPETPGMAGIFYAWGAGIARGHEVGRLRAIDVKPTVCHLLGISPAEVDGEAASGVLE